jgi:hypothetical protein
MLSSSLPVAVVPFASSHNIRIVTAQEYDICLLFYCSEESEFKNHTIELRVSMRQKLQLRTLIVNFSKVIFQENKNSLVFYYIS